MTGIDSINDSQALIAVIGVAWTTFLALAKRAVRQVEEKIEDNGKTILVLQSKTTTMIGDTKYRMERSFKDIVADSRNDIRELSARLDQMAIDRRHDMDKIYNKQTERLDDLRKQSVTRDEFRMLALNLHTMLETIQNHISHSGVSN